MVYIHFVVTVLLFAMGLAINDDAICCAPRFVDVLRSCPDFDNEKFKLMLELGFQNDGEFPGLVVSGTLENNVDIATVHNVQFAITQLTDLGKEYLYTGSGNICASLIIDDQPWDPLIKRLNITGCPIQKGIRGFKDVVINTDYIKPTLTHEWCGEYEIEFKILDTLETVSCHIFNVEIYEVYKK